MQMQKTLAQPARLKGVGLHSGRQTSIEVLPTGENHGLVFQRIDLQGPFALVKGLASSISDTRLCTVLRNQANVEVRTVEHLLAALRACNIDNALVRLEGQEIPILDGSAKDFINAFKASGVVTQNAPRRVIRIDRPVRVHDGEKTAELLPFDGCRFEVEIEFDNPAIGHQLRQFDLRFAEFEREIAPARTFGELDQAVGLHAAGLALGASQHNALIFDGQTIVSEEGLRFDDECVRHKILDAIGDLYLIGAPFIGSFKGYKSGHAMHAKLIEALFADPGNFSWIMARNDALDDTAPFANEITEPSTGPLGDIAMPPPRLGIPGGIGTLA